MNRKIFLFKQNHHKLGARYKVKETQSATNKTWAGEFSEFSETTAATSHGGKTGLEDGGANRRILLRITLKRKGNTKVFKKELFKYKKDGTKADDDSSLHIINGKITSYKTTNSFVVLTTANAGFLQEKTAYDAISDTDIHEQTGSKPSDKLAAGGVFIIKEQWTSPKDWLKWTGGNADKLSAVLITDWDTNLPYNTSIMQANGYGNAVSEIS